jgi:hypothetical protein
MIAEEPLRDTQSRVILHNIPPPVRVGFTGTQAGCTQEQMRALRRTVAQLGPTEAHHGDCIGADAQFHDVAKQAGCRVVGHPPTNPLKRAWCSCDVFREEYPYLVRNHHIVDSTDVLIACPQESFEVTRSGTWATIRYARKNNKPIWLIFPDGSVRYEGQ